MMTARTEFSHRPARRSALPLWIALLAPPLAAWGCQADVESEYFEDTETHPPCEIGSEGCHCTTGGKCNDPFLCVINLNVCIADTCPVGTETCACTPNGSCDPGLMCASELCVDMGCSAGAEACPCTEGGGCDPGLECLSDLCVDAAGGDSEGADTTSTGGADSGTSS